MQKFFATFSAFAIAASALAPIASAHAAGAGDLVKCPDFSSVYYLAEDGRRYVYPNENVFFSWHNDFDDVKTISCADLASFSIGELVTYQAGTALVKFPSVPTVYAVEPDGVLRPIPDEATAVALFGENWAERVDDFSESFAGSVEIGEELAEDELPEGMIVKDEDDNLFRIEDDGTATEIDAVLDIDQEEVFDDHAIALDDIERRLGIALALIRVDNEAAIEVLEALLAELKSVRVDAEDEIEFEEIDEIEDEDDQREDAQDAIEDAKEEIEKAQEDLAEDEADGKDTSEGEALLASAQTQLAAAEAALFAGDTESAKDLADEARHDAMWARGKAVESINDQDEDEEDTEDAEDEDVEDEESEQEDESDDEAEAEDEQEDSDDDSDDGDDDSSDDE